MKNKLFIIVTLLVTLALVREIVMIFDWNNYKNLVDYKVSLSHGRLPEGSRFSCNELLGSQRLDVEFDGRMYIIDPIAGQPGGISTGCQILTDEAIEININ